MKEVGIPARGIVERINSLKDVRVKLENGLEVSVYISGKLNRNKIRVTPGDLVEVELSVYDLGKGRIKYRL